MDDVRGVNVVDVCRIHADTFVSLEPLESSLIPERGLVSVARHFLVLVNCADAL